MMLLVLLSDLWSRELYYNNEGDWFSCWKLDLGLTQIYFQDGRYEFGQWFEASYQVHFLGAYALEKALYPELKAAALPTVAASCVAWELVEEKLWRTCPVSVMDIAWGWVGAFLADAHCRGQLKDVGFSYKWLPMTMRESYIRELPGSDDFSVLFWRLVPGNYNPYSFALFRQDQTHRLEIGFTYISRRQEMPNEDMPFVGRPTMSWQTQEGLGFGLENAFHDYPDNPWTQRQEPLVLYTIDQWKRVAPFIRVVFWF